MAAFLEMGGYAPFVWPAYGLVLGVLAGLALTSRRRLRDLERRLERQRTEHPRRARPAAVLPGESAS